MYGRYRGEQRTLEPPFTPAALSAYISPISPLYLPYISLISPLYLPYISPRPWSRGPRLPPLAPGFGFGFGFTPNTGLTQA